jgi:hypothetical protein
VWPLGGENLLTAAYQGHDRRAWAHSFYELLIRWVCRQSDTLRMANAANGSSSGQMSVRSGNVEPQQT